MAARLLTFFSLLFLPHWSLLSSDASPRRLHILYLLDLGQRHVYLASVKGSGDVRWLRLSRCLSRKIERPGQSVFIGRALDH